MAVGPPGRRHIQVKLSQGPIPLREEGLGYIVVGQRKVVVSVLH